MATKKNQLEVRDSSKPDEDLDDTPKGRTREIPGTERKVHKDIKLAAARYVEVRDERIALSRKEGEKKAILIDRMKQHGLTAYDDGVAKVILTNKENVKVTDATQDDGEEDGEE